MPSFLGISYKIWPRIFFTKRRNLKKKCEILDDEEICKSDLEIEASGFEGSGYESSGHGGKP